MADAQLRASWARTEASLEAGRARLSKPDGPGIPDYLGYVAHNELALAFDLLVEIGVAQRAESRFWQAMHGAASEMKLTTNAGAHERSVATVERWLGLRDRHPCPCCGHRVFREAPGSYDICPVCFWEDDIVQLRWPGHAGGANTPSLVESQRNYLALGAMESRFVARVRAANPDEPIDDGWRTIDPAIDDFEPDALSEVPWPADSTALYWWRPTFWRRR